jgi:hypothetical protein
MTTTTSELSEMDWMVNGDGIENDSKFPDSRLPIRKIGEIRIEESSSIYWGPQSSHSQDLGCDVFVE